MSHSRYQCYCSEYIIGIIYPTIIGLYDSIHIRIKTNQRTKRYTTSDNEKDKIFYKVGTIWKLNQIKLMYKEFLRRKIALDKYKLTALGQLDMR